MTRAACLALAIRFWFFPCATANAVTTVFFDPAQVATLVESGVTSDTISSNGYLFTYTRDKLFTGGIGMTEPIGRPVRVAWPDGVEAQAVTTPPPGVTDYKARITLRRVDGNVFDLTAFTAQLLANTAGAGGSIEIMPVLNGEDAFNDPLYFDATGYYGQTFSYDTSPNYLGSTALLKGYDTYKIGLYVDFALIDLTVTRECTVTVISQQPVSSSICSSAQASFTVAASGSGPFTYQWRLAGVDLTDELNGGGGGGVGTISGATTPALTISPPAGGVLGAGDAGFYDCVVTDGTNCPATSDAAFLAINDPLVVLSDPVDSTTCLNGTATFSVSVMGGVPLAYQWTHDNVPIDTIANPSAATDLLVVFPVTAADHGSYRCVITNECGDVTSGPAALTVPVPVAPDLDGDCDVDDMDLDTFNTCMAGPALPYHPGCVLAPDVNGWIAADFDHDGDADQDDFGVWQRCYSGAGVLPDPNCAN